MVKITFKTVQNKLFTVDAEETETVVDLKKKIQESQTFPVENQKLIYSGKILQDAATVASLKIKEKDFLVVMVSKPKAAPAPVAPAAEASSAPAPTPAAETAAPSAPAPAAAPSTESAAPAPAAAEGGGQVSSQGGSFVIGEAREQAITSMTEMGFEREMIIRALRASFNNPDRAVEYLMSGNIPNTDEGAGGFGGAGAGGAAPQAAPAAAAPAPAAATAQQAAPTPAAAPTSTGPAGSAENLFAAAEAAMNRDRGGPAAGGPGAAGAGAAGAGGMNPAAMEALMNNPQMAAVRQAVQQNPALIQPLLQQLAASQPALAQMIAQNPEMLYQLLGAGPGGEGDDDEDFGMGQTVQVDLTADEAAAVERLEGLGFPRQMVLQAFMICDKNEELAANFLFDQGEDDQ